jgi:hypothetical protein
MRAGMFATIPMVILDFFCHENTETQKATNYFFNPIPAIAEWNFCPAQAGLNF